MAVYYKFKSAKDFDSVPIDGHFISVANLKEKIFETKHLGRGTDFDLMVSNAQTNEEYPDEDTLIPKNTSVLVRRVPGRPRMPIVTEREETNALENKPEDSQPAKSSFSAMNASAMTYPEEEWDEFGNDLYAIPEVLPVQSSNMVQDTAPPNRADEDSKIKALIDTPALDWQMQVQDGFGAGRGFGRGAGGRMMGGRGFGRGILERKTPPPGYICHRCKVPGHFIQHCPTNGDPNYDIKKTKPPTGIPKSMLEPTPDGSYALPSGAAAVLRPNEAAFEKEIEGLPSTRTIIDVPPELRCPLCKEVMQDAVLTSKCCFKSFCDKCIRNYIISKSACVCGATDVLADDLLPNKTVRETINRFLESNNSSAEKAGSMLQIQDMESARPAEHKIPSPTLSAASKGEMTTQPVQPDVPAPTLSASSKGEQLPSTKIVEALDIKEIANKANDTGALPLSLGTGRAARPVNASEATFGSMTVKEPASQGSAPLAEEEVQQKQSASEPGKKKKKKKARLPPNDPQWRAPQDIAADNYMMPFPPSCDPYWGNMQFGMEGYMNPYSGTMPYMGYVPGPYDVPMGAMLPQDPFGGQGYMMPVVPPQRDFPDFPLGSNHGPPMSRAEYDARKADLRRRRGTEGRVERVGFKDQEYVRDLSRNGDMSLMKSKYRTMSHPPESPDRYHQRYHHHRGERESSLDRLHYHQFEREYSPDRAHHNRLEREDSLDRAHHHRHRRSHSHSHRDEREISPERSSHHHHRHHRRTESPSRDLGSVRHVKRRSADHHDLPSRDPEAVRKRRLTEDTMKDTTEAVVMEADKKQKASVFSRISFPGEKKSCSIVGNGYKDRTVHHKASLTTGHLDEIEGVAGPTCNMEEDYESSDEERHFKRRPSRYEPPPPPPIEWEEEEEEDDDGVPPSRGSREHGHSRHSHR